MQTRYYCRIYAGRTFCGDGLFETLEECEKFLKEDGFCNKAIITDNETGKKRTIIITPDIDK